MRIFQLNRVLINKLDYFCWMINLRKYLDFYIQSSIHVGLAVFCLLYVTLLELDLSLQINFASCLFFGTVLAYTVLKYWDFLVVKKQITTYLKRILLVNSFALLGFVFFFLRLDYWQQWRIVLGGLLVLIYPYFRRFGAIKIFWVSLVIGYMTVYVPLQSVSFLPVNSAFAWSKRFCIATALMVPFEIYDYKYDKATLKTLPHLIGVTRVKYLGYFFLILFWCLNLFEKPFFWDLPDAIKIIGIQICVSLLIILSIYNITINRTKYFTTFWVESIPIFWALGLVFLKQI